MMFGVNATRNECHPFSVNVVIKQTQMKPLERFYSGAPVPRQMWRSQVEVSKPQGDTKSLLCRKVSLNLV